MPRDIRIGTQLEYLKKFCKASAEQLPAVSLVPYYGSSSRCSMHQKSNLWKIYIEKGRGGNFKEHPI